MKWIRQLLCRRELRFPKYFREVCTTLPRYQEVMQQIEQLKIGAEQHIIDGLECGLLTFKEDSLFEIFSVGDIVVMKGGGQWKLRLLDSDPLSRAYYFEDDCGRHINFLSCGSQLERKVDFTDFGTAL